MTDPSEAKKDSTRIAVEFLMLWMEADRLAAATHITDVLQDRELPEVMHVVAGLLNLNMFLAFELAKASGAEDYVAWTGEYLRALSPRLPDAD
ncbi:hypothetical protein [Streptomyces sp. CA-251247]|uniref:hypothetical protein n=1 Tax=Streptomyces sp. CA-251247 TaxID=3240062 RepID=UPI003D8C3BFC